MVCRYLKFGLIYVLELTSFAILVSQHKDWKGLDESTVLSRAFSDQGVRLRLRKEPRGLMYAILLKTPTKLDL